MMRWAVISVTTTGSAGSAVGTAYSDLVVSGIVTGVKVDYNGSAPNTTTVAITEDGGMQQNILTLAAGNTDGTYYPTAPAHTQAGAEVDAAVVRAPLTVAGSKIKVVIGASNALTDAVIVTVYLAG